MVVKKIAIINIFISLLFLYGCSSENKQAKYYVYAEINKKEHLCYVKKPLVNERYKGDLIQHGREEKIINCKIILPKQFKDKYSMCVLSGVTVDGSDHSGETYLKGWSCDVSPVISEITMYMKSKATRGVVSCNMLCIKK
ncbi:hypothetical protein EP47_05550 [Legionella norrlandica]|uniref:Lipoprotein n=1 Tax=Legionella norrlandica TaxID=1498499 RepID=A0A0A2SLY7_9GAMM|nr:hypothetical protein [Legionella norrlandica]KGP62155.1 hypothetical protein EP47_05550 [Legionella norrlandica]